MNTLTNPREQAALEKALALSKLDPPVHVLPCWRRGKAKGPTTPDGFYNASADETTIRELWQRYPGSEVGIWPGASLLLIEDLDVNGTTGTNGFISVDQAEVVWESCLHYRTPSGGEHHVWPATDASPGPAAPIRDFPGVDRRSGNSLCLWYGPVPTQAQWDAMCAQTTPSWLSGPSQGRTGAGGASRVVPADADDCTEWIESLTDGPAIDKFVVPTEHYGDLLNAIVALAEHTRMFPTWPGARATFEELTEGYLTSPVSTTPESDRPKKVVGIVRWALGATAEVEDMTWALDVFGPPEPEHPPVLAVPASIGNSKKFSSHGVNESASTDGTASSNEVH